MKHGRVKSRACRTSAAIAALILGIAPPAAANASQGGAGAVTGLNPASTSDVAFLVGGARTTKPACATSAQFVFKTNTPGGQAMLAVLLTSQAQGKQVIVFGTNSCPDIPQYETVSYFIVAD